ncbi:MFS transporter [Streptomyces lydicus]|uniref:MFS transporter n=1 Tax=Streptomyces lydicus TaxID=47763 RepID=UPI0036F586F9
MNDIRTSERTHDMSVTGLVITMGTLGDRIGRRRRLMVGTAVFALASLVCAWATSPLMLIAARGVQGIAGATLMPSTLALITNMFRDDNSAGRPSRFGRPAPSPVPRWGLCSAGCCW